MARSTSKARTRISVFCSFQFEGFHRWKDAQGEVSYLANIHRHMFHVTAEKVVKHVDRDIEFITLKNKLMAYAKAWAPHATEWSCETWALRMMRSFNLSRVTVSEDGENGAIVEA